MATAGGSDEEGGMGGSFGGSGSIQSGRGRSGGTVDTVNEESRALQLGEFERDNGDVLGTISGTTFGAGRMYFSDVVAARDECEAEELCSELVRRGEFYRGEICIIAIHGDHVHVIHDCPYSNR